MPERDHEYLGDGVYASFDGWHIWLRTGAHAGGIYNEIALDPGVFAALLRYDHQVWAASREQGRTVPGTVSIASANGVSLMLEFEAVLAGHVAMMPVVWDDQAKAFLTVTGGSVVVELGESQHLEEGD